MSHDARSRLRATQDALVRALLEDAPVPDGFDPHQLAIAKRVVRDKRERVHVHRRRQRDRVVRRVHAHRQRRWWRRWPRQLANWFAARRRA